ncbi:hypothetical protein CUMW_229070, partial [Citrus unshiu]
MVVRVIQTEIQILSWKMPKVDVDIDEDGRMLLAEVVGAYSTEAKKLGSIILKLIADGLGPEFGYFKNQLGERLLSSINHYPPCPGPSLTLGLPKHCDPNLITIHFQGDVSGLQDGERIGVDPLPNAFVINNRLCIA